jgi:rhodanese-related sulfurtransferase
MTNLTAEALLQRARTSLDRLSPAQAWDALQVDSITLVDTRCAELRSSTGVIPGSVHAPLSVLYWRADPSSPHDDPRISHSGRRLVLLCADGYSSSIAAATLQELGHVAATDVDGGFSAWRAAGLPVEAASAPDP